MIAALVPAAGQSRRMGEPKLLLPIAGQPLIARVVAALRMGGAAPVVVVAPPPDEPGAEAIAAAAAAEGAAVVVPTTPTLDMHATVELGLAWLAAQPGARPEALLLVPGDSPGISPGLVATVLDFARKHPTSIVVPTFQRRRGHPVCMPWSMALKIPGLPAGKGINSLLIAEADKVVEIPLESPLVLSDLDTPEDYKKYENLL
jgi:molybdenum cofactor cytidylyltransferase